MKSPLYLSVIVAAFAACTSKVDTSTSESSPLVNLSTIDSLNRLNARDSVWYKSIKPIGEMSDDSINMVLESIGDDIENSNGIAESVVAPWKGSDHEFGFVPAGDATSEKVNIVNASSIKGQSDLKNKKIKVTLDRLYVKDYPGKGQHQVLIDFFVKNQIQSVNEYVHYNQNYKVMEGQGAGVIGFPIFTGLNVGSEGLDFKLITVNVKNKNGENILKILDSEATKNGLTFINQLNPLIPQITSMATGITKMIIGSKENVVVQEVNMGLDFSKNLLGARLAEGSYIVVQVPKLGSIKWEDWKFDAKNRMFTKVDGSTDIPFNYFVISVTALENQNSAIVAQANSAAATEH